jgi:hypothetical protein
MYTSKSGGMGSKEDRGWRLAACALLNTIHTSSVWRGIRGWSVTTVAQTQVHALSQLSRRSANGSNDLTVLGGDDRTAQVEL